MSTKSERAFQAMRHILPIKVEVRQSDGTKMVHVVDADVRTDKRTKRRPVTE